MGFWQYHSGNPSVLIPLQSYQNGRGSLRESILQDIEEQIVGKMYHTCVEVYMGGVMESMYIKMVRDME